MPKKKLKETAKEQAKRFQDEAQKLIDAGELNPTEAEEAVDRLVSRSSD
jgi:polyhydroxyalkanoate synthesis regulator phasin